MGVYLRFGMLVAWIAGVAVSRPCCWSSGHESAHIPKSIAQIPVPVPTSRQLWTTLTGARANFPPMLNSKSAFCRSGREVSRGYRIEEAAESHSPSLSCSVCIRFMSATSGSTIKEIQWYFVIWCIIFYREHSSAFSLTGDEERVRQLWSVGKENGLPSL